MTYPLPAVSGAKGADNLAPAGRNHWSFTKIGNQINRTYAMVMFRNVFSQIAPMPSQSQATSYTVTDVIPDGLTITDTIPDGLAIVSTSPQAVINGQTATWNLSSLQTGEYIVKIVTKVAGPNELFNNTAIISVKGQSDQQTNTTYHMLLKDAVVNVIHKDKDTGLVLDQQTYTEEPGAYGPYGPQTFTGYGTGALAPDSDPATGTIAAGETKNITYLYETMASTGTIEVKHVDKDTGAILESDSITVAAGNYGPINPSAFLHYGVGTLAPGSAPDSGTIAGNETLTVIYQYSKSATITYRPGAQGKGGLSERVLVGEKYTIKNGEEALIIMSSLPAGYVWRFVNWSTTNNTTGTKYFANQEITATGDMTLYSNYDVLKK
jgi:hypothetical protein